MRLVRRIPVATPSIGMEFGDTRQEKNDPIAPFEARMYWENEHVFLK